MSDYYHHGTDIDLHGTECVTVELDGITLTGTTQRGAHYGIESLHGWWDGTGATGGPVPYPAAHGGFQTPVYQQGRNIVIAGEMEAGTRLELWEMIDAIGKILAPGRWAPMVVTEEAFGLQRQVDVCRLREVQIDVTGWTSARYTLELQSAGFPKLDAVESSVRVTQGTPATLVNEGDYPAELTAVLTGPLAPTLINIDGEKWSLNRTLAAGEVVEVDFERRIVRNAKTAQHYRSDVTGAWPTLTPGSHTATVWTSGSAGTVELRWRSAWT